MQLFIHKRYLEFIFYFFFLHDMKHILLKVRYFLLVILKVRYIFTCTNLCVNSTSGWDDTGEFGGTFGVVSGETSGDIASAGLSSFLIWKVTFFFGGT